jgi:acyl carrier protein
MSTPRGESTRRERPGSMREGGRRPVTNDVVDVEMLRAQIRDFIQQNFLFGDDGSGLDDAAPLIETGILDATGVVELVLFLEETYDITVAESELQPDHFETINAIVDYVVSKLAA